MLATSSSSMSSNSMSSASAVSAASASASTELVVTQGTSVITGKQPTLLNENVASTIPKCPRHTLLVAFSLSAGEETVRVLDGLFGSTETSRALAAIVDIVRREMMASDGQASPQDSGPFGAFSSASKVVMLGAVTKAVTAFACLQKLTQRRKLATLPVETIFEFTVDYDRIRTAEEMAEDEERDKAGGGLGGFAGDAAAQQNADDDEPPLWESDDEREIVAEMENMLDRMSLVESEAEREHDEWAATQSAVGTSAAAAAASAEMASVPSSSSSLDSPSGDVRTITTITELPREESDAPLLRHQTSLHSLVSDIKKRASVVPQPIHVYPRQPLVTNLARYLQYSTGAYGKRFMRIFGIGRAPIVSVVGGVHHPNHHAFANHVGIPVNDIVLSSFQPPRPGYLTQAEQADATRHNFFNAATVLNLEAPRIHPLVHYLCIDHRTRSVVLTLRGTLGLSDVLTDLTCDYADLSVYVPDGDADSSAKVKRVYQAHAGMVKNAELLANQLGPYIKHALAEHPGYGLVLCGHSLGGGVAALLALLWSDRFNDPDGPSLASNSFSSTNSTPNTSFTTSADAASGATPEETAFLDTHMHRTAQSSGLPAGRPLHCFTYGCPCVVSHELSLLCGSLITSTVHGSDIVTCLSLGMLQDFKCMTRTLNDSRNRGVAEKIITKALGLDRSGGTPPGTPTRVGATVLEDDNDVEAALGAGPATTEEDWLWSLMQTLRAEMVSEKLYPPGTVYWLRTKAYVRRTTQMASSASDLMAPLGPARVPAQQQVHTAVQPMGLLPWPFAGAGAQQPQQQVHDDQFGAAASGSARAAGMAAGKATVTREERKCLVVLDRLEDVDDLVGELRFSRSMFTDHNPRFYEDGIRALELGVSGLTVTP
ncbi:hypothetical protein BCR44DRAFT_1522098 [Catenaria anguillulae PL171]|uniref:sn-1-specific diacylglycerol lipase n=1 Tax=Catenaria anguillulae PL171 TaxID=765915 RepID=A0A1Y2HTQ3_9FUNG|nr:hypothetical protein BCR44DRAFT_1522098 [Catenaria anguillulae PL171]